MKLCSLLTHIVPGGNNLTLPNGVCLSFGNIIAMAGDYYGIPNAPIIYPLNAEKIDDGALQRFKNAYNTLAVTPNEGKYKVWLTVKFSATNLCLLCSYTRLDGMQLKLCYFLRFGVLDRVIEHAGSWECKLEWSPKRTRTGWSIMKTNL